MPTQIERRDKLNTMLQEMRNERTSFRSHWRDLADYILPRRQRFFLSDVNRGERKNLKIYDSTATFSSRTLRSGMMAGVTSPARPWFRLTVSDPELAESFGVREWLHEVTERMRAVFLRSNLYRVLPVIYGDIGVFGTAAVLMEEDFDSVLRFSDFPIGSYMIANDEKGQVRTFAREYRLTVGQIVEKFGRQPNNDINWENISNHVKTMYLNGNKQAWVDVVHYIIPNDDWRPNALEAKYKRYLSIYYELGSGPQGSQIPNSVRGPLRESGFDYFPVMAPRWDTSGEDVYGTGCPGMTVLGDVKQLQTGEKRILQAVEKMVNPPMKGPPSMRKSNPSILPGDLTYVEETGDNKFSPVHQVDPRINEMETKQAQVRQRIQRGFYEDLFLMLSTSDRRQITAREIDAREGEKMLVLGPTLEQLNQDLLDPLIDNAYLIMDRRGLIPPPPSDLEGVDLKVEYVSIMAQAQKLVGISSIERFVGFVGQVLQGTGDPQVLDKIKTDEIIKEHHEAMGLSPDLIRSDEEVEEIRKIRSEQAEQARQIEAAKQMSSTAKDLGTTPVENDNALGRIINATNAGI